MRLRVAAPAAALAGAAVAAVAVLALPTREPPAGPVMPAASPAAPGSADFDSAAAGGGDVEHPAPPSLPMGAVAAGYGATDTGPADVPVRFPQSADGAAAAVTAWLATVEGAGVLNTRVREAVLAAIGDQGFVSAASVRLARRATDLGVDVTGRPAAGYVGATVWAVRGAYRVVSYDGAAAQVEVWHLYQLGVVAPGAQPGPGVWRRATGVVRWDASGRDWRLASDFGFVDGPDPKVAVPSRIERVEALAPTGDGWRLYANTQE